MAQYESGTRTPKEDLKNTLAEVLEVSPQALAVPDIESEQGLMHTLFTLEDLYGLKVELVDGEITKDQYDQWRYNYPKYDTTGGFHTISSQKLSDDMVDRFKDKLKDM